MAGDRSHLPLLIDRTRAGEIILTSPDWAPFRLGPLRPRLTLDGSIREGEIDAERGLSAEGTSLATHFADGVRLEQRLLPVEGRGLRLRSEIHNTGRVAVCLNAVTLLASGEGSAACFGQEPARVRIYEQGNYWARVRPLTTERRASATLPGEQQSAPPTARSSLTCWLAYDRASGSAFLAGFETQERWLGEIGTTEDATGIVTWRAGFDGGDLRVEPGERRASARAP